MVTIMWPASRSPRIPSVQRLRRERMFSLVIASATLLLKSSATAQSSPWDLTGPELKIAGSNNNVTASWPISPFDFVLETAGDLSSSGMWTAMSFSQNVVGDEMTVTVPVTNAHQFFRVERPSSIPVFQFAIFYNVDLEVEPGPNMTVTGRVHSNGNIYQVPGATLTFQSPVSAANMIYETPSPLDPTVVRSPGTVIYQAGHVSSVRPLSLPIGTSDPNVVHEILKPPPVAGDTDPSNSDTRLIANATAGRAGSIVLMHIGPASTPRILAAVIARYRAQGYRFVTIPELLALDS